MDMQVAAACLYIVCRQDEKPYMLIDFSDALQVGQQLKQIDMLQDM
jgi:transcription factor IIIB 90 kDa subunit